MSTPGTRPSSYLRRPMARPDNVAEILDRFAFHPATEVTGPQHDHIREVFREVAGRVMETVPAGRHQSLALTALQESMMWCNAGIACDTKP